MLGYVHLLWLRTVSLIITVGLALQVVIYNLWFEGFFCFCFFASAFQLMTEVNESVLSLSDASVRLDKKRRKALNGVLCKTCVRVFLWKKTMRWLLCMCAFTLVLQIKKFKNDIFGCSKLWAVTKSCEHKQGATREECLAQEDALMWITL